MASKLAITPPRVPVHISSARLMVQQAQPNHRRSRRVLAASSPAPSPQPGAPT
ncbi:MAG: hypothetical protein HKO05_08570 [Erythrobacter sp.]|nr:hypothetical protein [Erythrobacter sp.]